MPFKRLHPAPLTVLFLVIAKGVFAQVTLETQVKITDEVMFFDGNRVAISHTANNPNGYDYVYGNALTPHGDCIKAYKHFVFMTWYRGGKEDRHVMLTRYNTLTGVLKTIEFPHRHTGYNGRWWIGETHNTIAVGICPKDETIHLVYDMHRNGRVEEFADDYLRYSYTYPGAAVVSDDEFDINQFVNSEAGHYKHLFFDGINDVNTTKLITYPAFLTNDDGDLFMKNRFGFSENGNQLFARYDGNRWHGYYAFNRTQASSHGSAYNWNPYGDYKWLNGKLRIGFQRRSNNGTDKFLYQNGIYYAYSDDPTGVTQWKSAMGEPLNTPIAEADLVKIAEPGDWVETTQRDQVSIVSGFDFTVTEAGDEHFVSLVRDNEFNVSKQLHTYRKAGDTDFTTVEYDAGSELYASGNDVFLIGLSGGRVNIVKTPGGESNFQEVYQQRTGPTFDKGVVHVYKGKAYYYLKEAGGSGDKRTTYLMIIDLDVDLAHTGQWIESAVEFPNHTDGEVDYYVDGDTLAIDGAVVDDRHKFARATQTYTGSAGTYDFTITTELESEGESIYRLLVNGVIVGTFTNRFIGPGSAQNRQRETHTWHEIRLMPGDTIAVESNTHSNGTPALAWSEGRWSKIELTRSSPLVIQPPIGRIAIVADGNSPDPSDIGSTAVMLGSLKSAGLSDRLVHLSHSNDLDPFTGSDSNSIDSADELRRQNKLEQLISEGIDHFGPYPNLTSYYNSRAAQSDAVNDLRNAINASLPSDPLWIILAGEPDIVGLALESAIPFKRRYVYIVHQGDFDKNSGDTYTWQQILDLGIAEHAIRDQSSNLRTPVTPWNWANNHAESEIVWIWDQLTYAEQDGVVEFQTDKFDVSDAGMMYWWITGADQGGDSTAYPSKFQNLLLSGNTKRPIAHWPLDEGRGLIAGDVSGNGYRGTLLNGPRWDTDAERGTYISFDGKDDHLFTTFTYALEQDDNFTWAWWAKRQGSAEDDTLMLGNRFPQPGAGGNAYEFIKLTPTQAQFARTGQTTGVRRYPYRPTELGTWHHYALVKKGTQFQWYIDGAMRAPATTIDYAETTPIPFFIGGDDGGTGSDSEFFEGAIDDVVLYERALSESELIKVMNGIYGDRYDYEISTLRLLQVEETAPVLDFHYTRKRAAIASGRDLDFEWSDSLSSENWNPVDNIESTDNEDPSVERLKISVPNENGEPRFIRLKVETP